MVALYPAPKPSTNSSVKEYFEKYTVWLFYWWKFCSNHRDSLREFRKTIVYDDFVAAKHARKVSSDPVKRMGKIIDKYKTW